MVTGRFYEWMGEADFFGYLVTPYISIMTHCSLKLVQE